MRGFLPSNHMYIVELYAKLITREPNYPWRVPSETAALLEKSVAGGMYLVQQRIGRNRLQVKRIDEYRQVRKRS